MTGNIPLDPKTLLQEAESLPGALGAIAYVVLKGLHAGGADAKVVSSVRLLMQQHFQNLSDADCNALCAVLQARLKKDGASGKWY